VRQYAVHSEIFLEKKQRPFRDVYHPREYIYEIRPRAPCFAETEVVILDLFKGVIML
jgi:hypothetical protein